MHFEETPLFVVALSPSIPSKAGSVQHSSFCSRRRDRGLSGATGRHISKARRLSKNRARYWTIECVGANEPNPLAWALNGFGNLTASAWTAIAGRIISTVPKTDSSSTESKYSTDKNGNEHQTTMSAESGSKRAQWSSVAVDSKRKRGTSLGLKSRNLHRKEVTEYGEKDDDGLSERLAARDAGSVDDDDDDDGVEARLRARHLKEKQLPQSVSSKQHDRGRSGNRFFFLGKREKKPENMKSLPVTSKIALSLEDQKSFGGLSRTRVVSLVNEALMRQSDATLDTLLPYDMQRAMFSDIRDSRSSTKVQKAQKSKVHEKIFEPTVSMSRDALRPVGIGAPGTERLADGHSTILLKNVQRDIEKYDPSVGSGAANKINKARGQRSRLRSQSETPEPEVNRWGWLMFWRRQHTPDAERDIPQNEQHKSTSAFAESVNDRSDVARLQTKDKAASVSLSANQTGKTKVNTLSKEGTLVGKNANTGGVLTVPLVMVGDLLQAVWIVRDQGKKSNMNGDHQESENVAAYAAAMSRDGSGMDESDISGGGAAVAFAAASAIASSSVSYELDAVEAAGLQASVSAARAISTTDDADVFIETVGVGALVTAARVLKGRARSSALTALANIAIMCPKSRMDMLRADKNSLVTTIGQILHTSDRFGKAVSQVVDRDAALCRMEAIVSGTHLLGSLALARGNTGLTFRRAIAKDVAFVQTLKKLAGGIKFGEPEGAARAARRALGALGVNTWSPRVAGQRGLRILSIDGGGTRAIMAFEMLKHLKKITGCEIHEMFDVIGGTSTGAIVAASLGIAHKTVEDVEILYRKLIGKIFAKHPVNGPKMLLTRAYYDTRVLEAILKEECGTGVFIDSLAEENMNKVFVVSSIMSRSPHELHVFRNYTYPLGHESRYEGTAEAQLWEALRASSAAPTFFSEIRVNGELHADGAIVANNPTAVALHEVKCMYPGVPIEVVVSMGNGLSEADISASRRKAGEDSSESSETSDDKMKAVGWGQVVGSIVASATSTEAVHHALSDLFPNSKYFRFNPSTRSTEIDETSPDKLADFVNDAITHIEENRERFAEVARALRPKTSRSLWRRFRDALSEELQALSSVEDDVYLI